MNPFVRTALLTLTVLAHSAVNASDLDKEKRWADQVVDAIIDGDAVWLNDGKSEFLSIYTEAEDDSDRGVVIMHGTGIHPDWQQVVQPLRVELTTRGWHTLSIQMPILHNEAEYPEYAPLYPGIAPRIDAAIAFLRDKGIGRIVLVGHSQGATMGAYYLRSKQQGIAGFAAIGMSGNFGSKVQDSVRSLESIRLPVLDLYGSSDLESVLNTVSQRAKAARHAKLTQVRVEGANHYFDDKETELVEAVSSWLDKL